MDKNKLNNLEYLAERAVAINYLKNENFEKGLPLFKKVLEKKENKEDIRYFIDSSLKYASTFAKNKDWFNILRIYKDVMGFKEAPHSLYKNLGLALTALGFHKEAIEYFKFYEELEPDDKEVCVFIGELALNKTFDFLLAIKYYEKAVEAGKGNFVIFNSLGHLYSKVYRDSHKEEQLKYFRKAYELEPNNEIVVKNLAYVYGKFGDIKEADEMYGKMMLLKPSHSDMHSYGAYLVKNKRFKMGFKFLRHRFQKEDIPGAAFGSIVQNMGKVWKIGDSLEGKKVLVHYEQGFGDTIMFIRFVNDIKDKCKNVEVAVQPALVDLLKDSEFTFPIKPLADINVNDYDVIIPMMDLPLVCDLKPDNIPYAEGYLKVPEEKVKEYRNKYIKKNKKLKVGFAFEGSEASLETKRDIPVEFFYKLMRMKNVDMYCFQVGDIFKQLDKVPKTCKFTRLADTFKNWEDTALALKNMDLVITSDNGVMNLAGALGVKTFGVFNSMTEWRWIKTEGDDIAWYKTVRPFQASTTNNWAEPMIEVTKEVGELVKSEEK